MITELIILGSFSSIMILKLQLQHCINPASAYRSQSLAVSIAVCVSLNMIFHDLSNIIVIAYMTGCVVQPPPPLLLLLVIAMASFDSTS